MGAQLGGLGRRLRLVGVMGVGMGVGQGRLWVDGMLSGTAGQRPRPPVMRHLLQMLLLRMLGALHLLEVWGLSGDVEGVLTPVGMVSGSTVSSCTSRQVLSA